MPLQCICPTCGRGFLRNPANVRAYSVSYCWKACYTAAQSTPLAEQLEQRIDRTGGPSACWPWTGGRNEAGYGLVYLQGRRQPLRAHRLAWEAANGRQVPDGLFVRHLCTGGGNRWCCNPSHLEPGPPRANSDDMVRASRQASGERNAHSRLTAGVAMAIISRYESGELLKDIAGSLDISITGAWGVVSGRTWGHATGRVYRRRAERVIPCEERAEVAG